MPSPHPAAPMLARFALVTLLCVAPGRGWPATETGPARTAPTITGEAVYKHCVACHGPRGAGGEGGKYPRIAGLPAEYVARQLHDFRQRIRINKPMIPIFRNQRFTDEVIGIVAAHVAAMPVPALGLWPHEPPTAALAAFPSRADFDAGGAELYAQHCAGCHGPDGQGAQGPPLTDQYPAYLRKQVGDFDSNQRRHAASAQCAALPPADTEAVIGYLIGLGRR